MDLLLDFSSTKLMSLGKPLIKYSKAVFERSDAYLNMHLKGESFIIHQDGLLHIITKITMIAILIPFLVLFAVLGSIKALAPFFGGDASIAGLTHFL